MLYMYICMYMCVCVCVCLYVYQMAAEEAMAKAVIEAELLKIRRFRLAD